ncbi:MAG: hypothetical protein WBS24_02930 [Terriglobales bacterium]
MANMLPPTRINCRVVGEPRDKLKIIVSNAELNATNPRVSGLFPDRIASSSDPASATFIASRVKLPYPAPSKQSAMIVSPACLLFSRSVRHLAGTNAFAGRAHKDRGTINRAVLKVDKKTSLLRKRNKVHGKALFVCFIQHFVNKDCGFGSFFVFTAPL